MYNNSLAKIAVAGVVAVGGSLHCEACKERDTISFGSGAAPRASACLVQQHGHEQERTVMGDLSRQLAPNPVP